MADLLTRSRQALSAAIPMALRITREEMDAIIICLQSASLVWRAIRLHGPHPQTLGRLIVGLALMSGL